MIRDAAFFVVGTLVLAYLGHFGLQAVLVALAPELAPGTVRTLEIAMVVLAATVTVLVLRRLRRGRGAGG